MHRAERWSAAGQRSLPVPCHWLLRHTADAAKEKAGGNTSKKAQHARFPPLTPECGLRVVLHLETGDTGRLSGMAFLIDQSPDGFTLTSAELADPHTQFCNWSHRWELFGHVVF